MSLNYYLMASVPAVAFDAPAPMTPAVFLARCREHLDPAAATLVEQADAPTPPKNRFLRDYRNAETLLRNCVAWERASRLDKDVDDYVREASGCDPLLERLVGEAFNRPTPLERERALDRIRWNLIDELAGFNPFSQEAVLAYALKLRIASRWDRMDDKTGAAHADHVVLQASQKVDTLP